MALIQGSIILFPLVLADHDPGDPALFGQVLLYPALLFPQIRNDLACIHRLKDTPSAAQCKRQPVRGYRYHPQQLELYRRVALQHPYPYQQHRSVTIASRREYDPWSRKKNAFQQIGSQPEVQLSSLDYNEVGQLKKKRLNGTTDSIAYIYNERGWVKEMNASLFSEHLDYDATYHGATAQYNGNIAEQEYSTTATGGQYITYAYDPLNRLTAGTGSASGMSEAISYDVMGNIASMNRNGAGASTYSYSGNQLTGISGSSISMAGSTYAYDANGNMTTDARTGKTVSYNYLNLPNTVSGGITYTYDAQGNKLKKVNTTTSTTTSYINGIQYNGSTIDFIQTEEGIARNNSGTYSYEYNLKDHLGNTRLTFYKNPSTGSADILQQDNYLPFGMAVSITAGTNKYLYNGKEVQDELSGQLDYGARFYDPVVGRFNSIDPLAEKSRRFSTYVYGNDNPIRFIDPDGMESTDWVKGKNGIRWDKDANDQSTTRAGETYLGKDLKFTFNSYINNTFDGPIPPWGVEGNKLTSTIDLKSHEDAQGNLTSVDVKSNYTIGETGGIDFLKGRNFFPGLGKDQNSGIDIMNTNGFNATFEQHASVPGVEAAGLALLGYSAVNVAQKMTLGLSGNNLSVNAATDIFPSATLSVNNRQLFKYDQPSFKGTHSNALIRPGGITLRPAPNFYNRYNQ